MKLPERNHSSGQEPSFVFSRRIPEDYTPPCQGETGLKLCDHCLHGEQLTCPGGAPVHAEATDYGRQNDADEQSRAALLIARALASETSSIKRKARLRRIREGD